MKDETAFPVELYQPSNGTEGMIFMDQFCNNCYHESNDGESPEGSCPILFATMVYSPTEDKYPNQWRYVDGKPTCIEFFKRAVRNAEIKEEE